MMAQEQKLLNLSQVLRLAAAGVPALVGGAVLPDYVKADPKGSVKIGDKHTVTGRNQLHWQPGQPETVQCKAIADSVRSRVDIGHGDVVPFNLVSRRNHPLMWRPAPGTQNKRDCDKFGAFRFKGYDSLIIGSSGAGGGSDSTSTSTSTSTSSSNSDGNSGGVDAREYIEELKRRSGMSVVRTADASYPAAALDKA